MKNFNLIEMLQGCSKRNGMTVSASNPDGQPTVNRQSRLMSYRGNLKNLAMIFAVLVMSVANIGMAWGASVTFTSGTGSGQINVSSGSGDCSLTSSPVTLNVKSPGAKTQSRQIWTNSGSAQSEQAFQLSSSADATYTGKHIEVTVASGYTITGLTVRGAIASTTAGTYVAYCWADAFSTSSGAVTGTGSLAFPGYNVSTSAGANISMTGIVSGTRTIRIYKKVKYDSTNKRIDGTNGSNNPSSAPGSLNVASITVTYIANPTFSESAGAELMQEEDAVTLTSAGNTIYYKWSTNSSAYAVNAGATLAGAKDGSGTSPVDATAPSGTGTYYLYAVAKDASGNYSAVVKRSYTITAAAVASDSYDIHIGKNNADYTDESLTNTSGTTWSKTITLDAGSYYEFKVKKTPSAGEAVYYGNNGRIFGTVASWDFSTSDGNCKFYTSVAGSYSFSWDASNNQLSVTYPAGSHPTKRIYMACGTGTWCDATPKFYVHSWLDSNTADTELTVDACDGDVYTAEIPWFHDYVIFTRQASSSTGIAWDGDKFWNRSNGDFYLNNYNKLTFTSWTDGKGDFSGGTYSPTPYTVTTAVSTAGYGTVSAASVSSVPCGTSISASTNTLTVGATSVTATAASATDEYAYAFDNWTWTPAGATVTSNVTATANFTRTPKSYTLTWNLAGGTVTVAGTGAAVNATGTPNSEVAFGTAITAPTVTRAGYTFAGWSSNPASTMPAANTTYTATWTAKTTAITLDKNNSDVSGSTSGSVTATYGSSTLTSLSHATRTGYTQNGYLTSEKVVIIKADGTLNSSKDGYTSGTTWINESSSLTLYARWSATSYTLSYDLAGGNVASDNPTSYTIESSAITLNNPTKTGYTFAGWTGTGLAEATTTVTIAAGSTGNRSYTATWTAIVPSSVTLNKTSTSITVGGTETLTATISPAVVADNTITWTSSDETVATVTSAGVVTGVKAGTATITATTHNDKTATCEVTVAPAVTYTVTYEYNGATSGDETESATGASVTLPEPTKTGYELEGWYTTAGAKVDDGGKTYSPTADITLYARWTETCSGGGGGSGETKIIGFTTATCDKNASSGGERTLSNVTNLTVAHEVVSGTTDAIAAYGSADKDGITYNNNTNLYSRGGYRWNKNTTTSLGTSNNTVGYSVTVGSGYEFTVDSISFGIAASANMVYQIIIYQGSDTLYKSAETTFTRGASATNYEFHARGLSAQTKLQNLTGTFYVRVRLAFNGTGKYLFFPMFQVIGDLHTTAGGGSSSACHKVLYHGNGAESGYIYDSNVYDDGDDPEVLGNTTGTNGVLFVKDGYTFQGWATSAGGSVAYSAGDEIENIEDDVNLYAVWEEEGSGYTVSIAANPSDYGSVSASSVSSVASGTTLSTSTNTLSVGATNVTATAKSATAEYTYSFNNWTKNDGTALPSTVTADLSVYANFTRTANSYTLAWSSNGGSELSGDYTSGSTAYGASITAPTDPTLSNYTFDGWKTNNDGTGTTAGSTMPAAATTYYAAWKQTVTLKTGAQGSGADQTPYVYINGTGVSSFTAHTATGYTLQGYYTAGSGGVKVLNANGTFAAANVTDYITSSKWSRTDAAPTLYAQWVAAEDCSTSDFVIRKGDATEYQGCMESSSYNGTATSFTAGSPTTVGNAKMTISNYSDGAIKRPGSGNTFTIVIEPVSGYYLKSICWAGKVEDDETVSYYWDDNSGSAITISPTTTSGTGVTYNAPSSTTKFTASYTDDGDGSGGIWWRNVQVEVCAAGGATYNVTYDGNDETSGDEPTDADSPYDYGTTVTVLGNTGELAKTNYTFAGWTTNNDGTGSSYVEDNTFSITANTTLYAKWTQAVTLDKNGGSTNGSATAVWNATGLTGITHAKPASGYKLLGYYSASSDGTKVLNSDGSFAATNVTGYITSGKWSRTSATTLYAEYESAGALTWNLIVNSDTANLSTSTKTSAFTEISTTNMTDAALTGLTYSKGKKSSLTGKISTPDSYNADKYVYVTFQVASGYKFIPSSIAVKVQPVGENEHKAVELSLADATNTLASSSATKCDGTSSGKTTTVTLAGNGTYFTGTVTLKIYVYPHDDAKAAEYNCYRLGTPITIEGEIEETCATMPSYTNMSYTTLDYTLGDTPSAISITGGTNINTYTWKQNTTNDRSGGSAVSTGTGYTTPSFTPSIASAGTTYYWCEMTNTSCGITIKSPAVAVTVSASKSTASVTWDTKAKYNDTDTTAYYGGKNYTLKATLNSGWDGTLTADMFTAPTGIRLHDFTIDNSSNPKTIKATFDVQTTFDIEENDSIDFTLSLPETTTYNALSSEKKVAYNECSGSGEGSSYNIRVRKAYTKVDNKYYWENTDGWISSPNPGSSISSGKAGTTMATVFDSVSSTNAEAVYVRTYHANIKKVRIYADFRANNMTVSNVYKHSDFFTANAKYAVEYTAVYNGDEENENLGTAAQGYVDITLNTVMSANDILLVKFNTSRVRPLGAVITEGSAGGLTTTLGWDTNPNTDGDWDTDKLVKTQSAANFTYTASPTSSNSNTLGAVTYSSSNTSCATVNATTGEVTIVATGSSNLSTTITATLAASGCYTRATLSYNLQVTGQTCTISAGTLSADKTSKCESDNVTLTLADHATEGTTITWYRGETDVTESVVSNSLTTSTAGTYSVTVAKDACTVRSNSITISNISATASVTKIVDEWYVKNGRLTPDIALWTMSEGATLESVTWDDTNETGLSCYARDGVIYLEGKEPSSNESGADIEYTLTATILDACGGSHEETTKTIKITHQKNTDKHVLAFVVEGTAKGGFTAGITAAQTTNVDLYNTIATNFDVLATNIYSTDDEKKLKEYYSQFDILCITDYPNTKTKGVNSKSYVDAMGALVDIRPILTMEAWVSGLTNWKAKGISGTPSSPTTRQYTMLLQCKDHEIFSGTKLTKIGEGDETMYRISMVCDTLEDYKTLDATYGSGTHESDKNYQYGKKPALQGFTFTKEMLDDELLPLGLIDDGSGNDLQVGIERQTEMEARLMVLGINSYAMERLTDDGQTVVVNALKYLMKKNSEDIADCSNTFVGGDDDEAESTRYDWNVDSHWSGNAVPERTQKVRIVAPCVIKADEKFHVTGVVIAPSGKYNHGANTANGSLKIEAGGALIVDGKVEAATAPLYTETRATTPTDLILKTNSTAQSALIFDNEDGETQATVELYSLGRKESGSYYYQYMAVPMESLPVNPSFAGSGIYTYVWNEASGWERRGYYTDLYAFEGVGITTKFADAKTYEMKGTLASTETREIALTHNTNGQNMIGNSWTAPIQIADLEEDNSASEISQTVYIYSTGNGNTVSGGTTASAGQWLAIPFSAAGFEAWDGLKVIPAMQTFNINVTGTSTLTLDYDKVVRKRAAKMSVDTLTTPLHAPKRSAEHEGVELMRIRVEDSQTHTDLYLFKGERFSDEFDNGWEAEYLNGDGRSAKLYAQTEIGKMAVVATDELEGTVLGFEPGKETEYTFTFGGEGMGYYLNDLKLKKSTWINAGETYSFTYEEGDINRFIISTTPITTIMTGCESVGAEAAKVRKLIINDKVYIIRGGRMYSVDGQMVK